MFGTFFLLTQYLQVVRSYTPLEAGLRTLPIAVGMMVMAPMSARFVERWGARAVVSSGLTFVAAGLLLASLLGATTPYIWLAMVLVVMAIGMSITMAPATASIMTSLPLRKAGVGSAWNDTTRELGGALGVAVLGSVMSSQYTSDLAGRLGGVPIEVGRAAESSVGAAVQISAELPAAVGDALSTAAKSAFIDAMGVALVVAAGVALVAAAAVRRYFPATSELPARDETVEPAEPASATSSA
jgi:MFS family permease